MRIYSPTDDKFYDTLDTIDTFNWIMPDPEPWDGDYYITHLDDEQEYCKYRKIMEEKARQYWDARMRNKRRRQNEEEQTREGSDSEPTKTEESDNCVKAEEEMKEDHEEEKNEKMTKSDCDPDNIATGSIYEKTCDSECIVNILSPNKFLSLQEFMASNYVGKIGSLMKLPGNQMGDRLLPAPDISLHAEL